MPVHSGFGEEKPEGHRRENHRVKRHRVLASKLKNDSSFNLYVRRFLFIGNFLSNQSRVFFARLEASTSRSLRSSAKSLGFISEEINQALDRLTKRGVPKYLHDADGYELRQVVTLRCWYCSFYKILDEKGKKGFVNFETLPLFSTF